MPNEDNSIIEPEDTNTPAAETSDLAADAPASNIAADAASPVNGGPADPNDEIPVPIVMEPAEIDERAQVVEALRGRAPQVRDDDSEMRA